MIKKKTKIILKIFIRAQFKRENWETIYRYTNMDAFGVSEFPPKLEQQKQYCKMPDLIAHSWYAMLKLQWPPMCLDPALRWAAACLIQMGWLMMCWRNPALTHAGDSWFSASLYLLSLWGSHGGSRGIFIPPECKCPAFCLTITEVRVEWVVVVSAQRMSPTVLQPGPFFRISGLDFNTNPETKTPVTFFFMSDIVIYLHVIWFIQLIPNRYGEWVWNADAPTVQIHVCN